MGRQTTGITGVEGHDFSRRDLECCQDESCGGHAHRESILSRQAENLLSRAGRINSEDFQGDSLNWIRRAVALRTSMRILIVEDDRKLANQIQKGLNENSYSTFTASDGRDGLEAALQGGFDVLVLDVMLPGLDGFSLVRKLREVKVTTPVLLLTAKDDPEDIVQGLDAGADDYLTKPFSFKVLMARLRALARRKTVDPAHDLKVADLVLDPASREVRRAGAPIPLTRTEFMLLEFLMRNSGRVMTRERLFEAVWGADRDVDQNTLEQYISMLRAKIDTPGTRKLIHTSRGVGYVMRDEESV
jgi:DNA-binding response OmpR family regulator